MNLKITYTSILLCISALVFGQTLPESPQGIRANFTAKSIEAYQENSQNKIREFYEYLTLYSNEKNTELKKQIRENILSLTDSDMEILDFTSTVPSEIELDKFLSKIENQSFEFKIKSVQNSAETGSNDWINSYLLWVIQDGKTSDFKLNQTINFEPKEKQFGSKTKTVWEMKLGDVTAD